MKTSKKFPRRVYIGQLPESPLGNLWGALTEHGWWALDYRVSEEDFLEKVRRREGPTIIADPVQLSSALAEVVKYLDGKRKIFSHPVDWDGMTKFQIQVRKAVMMVPYGRTAPYGQIAAQLGKPKAARAVGRANATNPIPLVIPCHRLVGSGGGLRGYGGAGGVKTKRWLLDLEQHGDEDVAG